MVIGIQYIQEQETGLQGVVDKHAFGTINN